MRRAPWRFRAMTIGAILALAALAACGNDESPAEPHPPGPPEPPGLTTKEAVLNNVQYAYNNRDITKYDELLDADFVFFLATGNVGGGIPDSWGRAEDVLITGRMFDPTYAGSYRVKKITFDLDFESGVQWVYFTPASHPDETWYATVVRYSFMIDMAPDITIMAPPNATAEFWVRNVGTDTAPEWRLVQLTDHGAMAAVRRMVRRGKI